MAGRSQLRHAWRVMMRRHGQSIGICLIVLLVLALVGLLIWFMSGIRLP